MFLGAIPQELRAVLYEAAREWDCSDVYIGCSGNFTIERLLHPLNRFRLHSCDVSVYSWAVGDYLTGGEVPLILAPEWEEELSFLHGSLSSPAERLATLLLCSNILQYWRRDNPFFERMRQASIAQWERMHGETCAKVTRLETRLSSFTLGDAMDFVESAPEECGYASFPPFYKGGYEAMFERLAEVFQFTPPPYTEMDEVANFEYVKRIMQKRHWLFGLRVREAQFEEHLVGCVQPTNRAVPIYIYANHAPTRIAMPRQKTEPVAMPRLAPGEKVGERLWLAPLTVEQFNALRSQYLNPHIRPGLPLQMVAVCVDDRLIGCYAVNRDKFGSGSYVYLMSDFAVAPTDYPRLSKLVLVAALSCEAARLMERTLNRPVRRVTTTAFTKRAVSMKYRGLFELKKRSESNEPGYDYQLEYASDAKRWTLQEGMVMWRERWGGQEA